MKILVTGRDGQLARSLARRAADFPSLQLSFAGRPELDLAAAGSARAVIKGAAPDLVINTAAFTAVDDCETSDQAMLVNRDGAREVAAAAAACGAALIHISTDYVFSGDGPFDESARPNPLNAYGHSKLAGEKAVSEAHPGAAIVRTSWLYSPFGRNFVRTMMSVSETREEVRVVADQRGNPTNALDLADALLSAINSGRDFAGTYHIGGSGEGSWAELAEQVMDECGRLGLPAARIVPISSADWPAAAERPSDSRLDCSKFKRDFGMSLPEWHGSLTGVVKEIAAK